VFDKNQRRRDVNRETIREKILKRTRISERLNFERSIKLVKRDSKNMTNKSKLVDSHSSTVFFFQLHKHTRIEN
jgi:hypothetical protein